MQHGTRRLLWVCVVASILIAAWLKPLEIAATQQVDSGLKRALVSFGTARVLHGIISVAQGTEIAFEPAGVGVHLAPGQVLRPINDIVGQFAELMLAASVAFGVMKVLIAIGSFWLVSLAVSAFAIGWLWFQWKEREAPGWVAKLLFVLLLVRFAVPLVTVGSDSLFQTFLHDSYTANQEAISGSSKTLPSLGMPIDDVSKERGIGERIKGWWSQNSDVGARLEKLKQTASQTTEHIVNLIVVFLMQTLVMPLLLFWALWSALKALMDQQPSIGVK